ncbi:MAG: hemerythrin domain-containing protein [Burkholderiaceae bacterium]
MTARTLPGFDAPAVGFEQPFEMLEACHERVRRSLALLERLVGHVEAHGHDAQSRSAAADVLRYFELAAPLHHDDEERHVFPLLEQCGDGALEAATVGLRSDHARMEALWALLRVALGSWAALNTPQAAAAPTRQQAQAFGSLYAGHLRVEETLVFPAARSRIGPTQMAHMSADMQRRRQPGALS